MRTLHKYIDESVGPAMQFLKHSLMLGYTFLSLTGSLGQLAICLESFLSFLLKHAVLYDGLLGIVLKAADSTILQSTVTSGVHMGREVEPEVCMGCTRLVVGEAGWLEQMDQSLIGYFIKMLHC